MKIALQELKRALEDALPHAKVDRHIVFGSCYLMSKQNGSLDWSPIQKQEIVETLGHLDKATVEKLGSTFFKQVTNVFCYLYIYDPTFYWQKVQAQRKLNRLSTVTHECQNQNKAGQCDAQLVHVLISDSLFPEAFRCKVLLEVDSFPVKGSDNNQSYCNS